MFIWGWEGCPTRTWQDNRTTSNTALLGNTLSNAQGDKLRPEERTSLPQHRRVMHQGKCPPGVSTYALGFPLPTDTSKIHFLKNQLSLAGTFTLSCLSVRSCWASCRLDVYNSLTAALFYTKVPVLEGFDGLIHSISLGGRRRVGSSQLNSNPWQEIWRVFS